MKRKLVKLLAILGCLAMSAGIAACGDNSDDNGGSSSSGSSSLPEVSSSVEDSSSETIEDESSEVIESSFEEVEDSSSEDSSVEEEFYTEGLVFTLQDDDTYTVTGYEGTATEVVIPSVYNGKAVTSIGGNAFVFGDFTSVVIGDSITSIGDYAFDACDGLTEFSVDKNNTMYKSIDANLYSKDGKTLIQYAIGKTATSFMIPDGVVKIGKGAFGGCSSLTEIIISNSVTSIDYAAFYNCRNLTGITIPDGVTSIADRAFDNCGSLQYTIKDGLKYLGNKNNPYIYLADTETTDITTATIENGCKVIGSSALKECYNLTSVTVGENSQLASIGYKAFQYCNSLTEIVIPDSVTSIGSSAFDECYNLTSVTVGENSQLASIGSYAFQHCESLTEIVIPDSVTSIGDRAFYDCDSLTNITVEENNTAYKSIDGNLYSKDLATLIQYAIGKTATSFTIPNSVTSIGDRAFQYCNSLTEIIIPDSVTRIGKDAFSGCFRLQYAIKDGLKYLGNENNPYVYLADVKSEDITTVTIEESCKFIGDWAFSYCDNLTEIVIPDSVTSIGDYAFCCCDNLTEIVIPNSVTSIDKNVFSGCESLTGIVIPDSITSIGRDAFECCYNLTEIVIPDSVTSIDYRAFIDCDNLTIYCEVESQPSGWHNYWNPSFRPVYWYSESEPVTEGKYWHYNDNGEIEIW